MSGLLPLKNGIIYGPVRSRRLGPSLGINLMPPGRKLCTFDCLYCQYGWTPAAAGRPEGEADLPSPAAVAEAVKTALRKLDEPPAYLTFSGNGEPTLHPDFPRIVEAIRSLRDRLAPAAGTALLSNGGRVGDPAIRSAVSRLDLPILKFDSGNEAMFRTFNRPVPGLAYEDILSGLEKMPGITLQALFAAGPRGNLKEGHVAEWVDRVAGLRPRNVQVYTLSRPFPSRDIAPAPAPDLLRIRDRLLQAGIRAEVF